MPKHLYEKSEGFFKDGITCPFCKRGAPWVENKEKYGRNYGTSYMCYYCKPCDAYVGCHNNTRTPLGSMANKELREWRMKAHTVIDPLWESGKMKRHQVYKMLDNKMGKKFHVGWSDVEDCKKVISLLREVN